jgi:hypothetical protein
MHCKALIWDFRLSRKLEAMQQFFARSTAQLVMAKHLPQLQVKWDRVLVQALLDDVDLLCMALAIALTLILAQTTYIFTLNG